MKTRIFFVLFNLILVAALALPGAASARPNAPCNWNGIGNWTDVTKWTGGTTRCNGSSGLPTPSDDVVVNSGTLTLDQGGSTTVNSINVVSGAKLVIKNQGGYAKIITVGEITVSGDLILGEDDSNTNGETGADVQGGGGVTVNLGGSLVVYPTGTQDLVTLLYPKSIVQSLDTLKPVTVLGTLTIRPNATLEAQAPLLNDGNGLVMNPLTYLNLGSLIQSYYNNIDNINGHTGSIIFPGAPGGWNLTLPSGVGIAQLQVEVRPARLCALKGGGVILGTVLRCFHLVQFKFPTNSTKSTSDLGGTTMRLYFLPAELGGNTNPGMWWFSHTNGWTQVANTTNDLVTGYVDTPSNPPGLPNDPFIENFNGEMFFVLKDTVPTAVTLSGFSAHPVTTLPLAAAILLAVLLGGILVIRRRVR